MFRQGSAPRGYLNPTVRDRLVNYYATDLIFEDIQITIAIAKALPEYATRIQDIEALLAFKPSIEWYDTVSPEVSNLVQRSKTIVDSADALTGQIVGDYFGKVSDLVAGHGNLIWYIRPDVVAMVYDLVVSKKEGIDALYADRGRLADVATRRDQIMTLTGDTPGSTFTELVELAREHPDIIGLVDNKPALDWYSRADVSTVIGDLVSGNTELLDLAGKHTSIVGLVTNKPTLDWYSRADVSTLIGDLVSNGILPTIKEKATFNKDMDILGRLNLLENVQSRIKARFDSLDFTVFYDFDDKIMYPARSANSFWFNQRFTGLTGLRDWAGWIRSYMNEFLDFTNDWHRDKIVDAMLIFGQGIKSVIDCLSDILLTIKSVG